VVLGKHGGDRKSEKARTNQGGDATTLIRNTVPYFLARLNRDRPDLAARVRVGELSASQHDETLLAALKRDGGAFYGD
jgi:hypothetical protein